MTDHSAMEILKGGLTAPPANKSKGLSCKHEAIEGRRAFLRKVLLGEEAVFFMFAAKG